jgi:tRNA(fMet)-specific endonuclease VapC
MIGEVTPSAWMMLRNLFRHVFRKLRFGTIAYINNPFVEFLSVSYVTADRFGRISAALKQKGTPLPSNDIWIAAHAMESSAELLSFDRHFEKIEGLIWKKLK